MKFPRLVRLSLFLALGWLHGGGQLLEAAEATLRSSDGLPPAPEGYSSKAAIVAAIATGRLQLIEPEDQPPPEVREFKNIEYCKVGDHSLQLDLDLPAEATGSRPCLIFIHGGAWSGGERSVYHYYTRRFAQKGFAAATVSYRLSDAATYPAAVEDVKCAVRWLRAHAAEYHLDPARFAAIGGSAGGHLAMMVGYSSDNRALEGQGGHLDVSSGVAAVVNFYGPFDLTTDEGKKASPVRKFLGGTFDEVPDRYQQASPATHLNAGDPPTLVIHGTLDDTVSVHQADLLVEKLTELKIPHTYARLEGWPHTLDASAIMNEYCRGIMETFLRDHLHFPAEATK